MQDSKPSALACLPCRRRHLKCDARMPICSRCHETHNDCRYVRSRRGLRGRPGSDPASGDVDILPDLTSWLDGAIDIDPDLLDLPPLDTNLDVNVQMDSIHSSPIADLHFPAGARPGYIRPDAHAESLAHDPMIQLYYHHFHRAHPILLPRRSLASSCCQHIPAFIPHIMRYIGSHYYPHPGFSDSFHGAAYTALSAPNDGFKVQGLLLLSIIEHAYGLEETAWKLLREATQLACQIGLTSPSFAKAHSRGKPILEESWRRTYWELVVIEGIMTALSGGNILSNYKLINEEMPLPCEETAYNSEQTSPFKRPLTLATLPSQADSLHISSFTHRILAIKTLRTVLQTTLSLDSVSEHQTETLDARLVASLMRLPSSLPDHDTTTVDEMVFQTLMITYLSLIYLHHPHSTLRLVAYHPSTSRATTTLCPRLRALLPGPPSSGPPIPNTHTHTQKLLRAADLLSNLATLPSSVISRTPFFTCGLAIAVVVHVAALVGLPPSDAAHAQEREESLKARIELGVGALQVVGRVWPLARRVRGEMVEMYRGR
ncbi:C6 transcription factor [Aspergillus heteromorphus CBS 117.55]|uniref:C6 transcription factor n=1 Tax=Aspergillus heteromorphus CBS 117.55 TaxID=1448321 RepID=A0A317V7Z4_9EURO|nr:C6 transcription factor [Aspergillus heteromorphus CBS 117.55]PWY69499.1 C6 transcription factor [Aspergillus heteromorphus CBS 117.55]